jgi:TolB-like protein/DNA-binding winged helix-turn-helix (wHTH) protein
MEQETNGLRGYRFGVFEADLRAGEVRKDGLKLRLQEQPFQVLAILLGRAGDLVTRDELHKRLWNGDTFVDFDHGLNIAINKIREALGDWAENPRFVETLPKRGYRFIAPVAAIPDASAAIPNAAAVEKAGEPKTAARKSALLRYSVACLGSLAVFAGLVMGLNAGGWRDRLFGTTARQIESIAVLPFENLSGDSEQEYFADGMTDSLITSLGSVRLLRVVSRSSVTRYKRTRQPLPEIARELNVDAVVEGAVVRSGDYVRVTVHLLDARADRHLWAGTFEEDRPGHILSLQRHVAREVLKGILFQLSP